MKRKIRITESQLNTIIKKKLREQGEEQYMSNGPNPGEVAGSPEEDEGGEPNYEAFMSAAQELMGQGITIGNLVDKLCEAKDNEAEPETEVPDNEPEPESVPSPAGV